MSTQPQIPSPNSVRNKAGLFLHQSGPATEAQLLAAIYFGKNASTARGNLRHLIETGWIVLVDGLYSCSAAATEHYAATLTSKAKKYVGQIVPARHVNLMPLKSYTPTKPIRRADALDNSLAAIPSHFGRLA